MNPPLSGFFCGFFKMNGEGLCPIFTILLVMLVLAEAFPLVGIESSLFPA